MSVARQWFRRSRFPVNGLGVAEKKSDGYSDAYVNGKLHKNHMTKSFESTIPRRFRALLRSAYRPRQRLWPPVLSYNRCIFQNLLELVGSKINGSSCSIGAGTGGRSTGIF